jgi:hypothetical protein
MTRGTYLSVTLLFLVSLFLFPRPYLQPSDGSSPCDGASVNRARRPHAGERELRRCGAEPSAASPPIHRPPFLPIRRALRRIPSHLAARLARPGGAARTARRARLTRRRKKGLQGAQIDLQSGESNSGARESSSGRANRAQADGRCWWSSRSRDGADRGGSDGGAQGPGRPDLCPCATRGSSTSGTSRGGADPTGGAQGAAAAELARRVAAVVPRLPGFIMTSAMGGVATLVGGARGEGPTTGWGSLLHPWEKGSGEASRGCEQC